MRVLRVGVRGGNEMITDKEIMAAWDNAFDTPVHFDHKPTEDDVLLVRGKAVAVVSCKAGQQDGRKEVVEWIRTNAPEIYASLMDWTCWQAFKDKWGIK